MGQRAYHLPILLLRQPIRLLWKDVTMPPIDCWMCKTVNCWNSIDAHFDHIETAFVHPILVRNHSYTPYWHPILRLYVLSFVSRSFITSQFLISGYPRNLIERWRGPIPFPRFRPAIDGMQNNSIVFGKYSSTSSPFRIKLLLLDFNDVPYAISNISTMRARSVRRVM